MDDDFTFQQLHKEPMLRQLEINDPQFQTEPHQIYADRIFQIFSDQLRWIFLDYSMGSGKTLTALNILKNQEGRFILVGNEATQNSFDRDIKKINMDINQFSFITVQKIAMMQDGDLIDYFSDSYIIIDEFQKLYSRSGLNSWGLAFKKLFKHQLHRCKVVCLSGTMFNATCEEIRYILEIFQEVNTGTDEQNKSNQKTESEMIQILAKHTISWNVQDPFHFAEKRQIGVGQQLIEGFNIVRCEMSKEQYEAYVKESQDESDLLGTSKYILPKYYYDGEKHLSSAILTGVAIQKENLKKCAPMPYFFIDQLHKILKQGSLGDKQLKKSNAYIDNINTQFGLMQYIQVLDENGFIQYGKKANSKTLCVECGKALQDHLKDDKLHYKPATYGVYSNNVGVTQRQLYVDVYNSYQNRFGQEMCLMMLTRIATTGLSLFSVTNCFILDNISEISLYDQIVARAIRFNGHMDLRKDQRFVNVYCLAPSAPGLKRITKHEQKWIDVYDEDIKIQKLYSKIRAIDYNANTLLKEKKSKKEVETEEEIGPYQKIFTINVLPVIVRFINNLGVHVIHMDELIKLLRNDHLVPFGFSLKNYPSELLCSAVKSIYDYDEDTGLCQFVQQDNYTYYFRNRVQQYPQIKHDKLKPVSINKHQSSDIFTQLNSTNNINTLRYYIKIFITQGVDMREQFFSLQNFAAFMIWDNNIYIEDDENNYVENHKKLINEIYNKDIYYVKDRINTLMKTYNITGYYQGNDVITKSKKKIKVANRYVDELKIVQFYCTLTLPDFKLITGNQSRNCFVKQPDYNEVFTDEKFFKRIDYESQIQQFKCRYILQYALQKDLFQPGEYMIVQ